MALRLQAYGGAGKVTGSNFLVESDTAKVLIDCGIEQGVDVVHEHVYGAFPFDPGTIDALVVTHSHLDHVGRIPKLVKDGFKGKIFMTPATRDLAALILLDSVGIIAEEAKKRGIDPPFGGEDVEATFNLVEELEYHVEKEIAPGLSAYFRNTGHILGSASVRLKDADGTSVALTGDIGNSPSPLLPDWEAIPDADAILMESVYGDRLHPEHDERVTKLREILKGAIARGGTVLIPAFSLERTQLMLYELSNFFDAGELPQVPVFLDSPLAIKITAVYEKWGATYFKPEAEAEMKREKSLFKFPFLKQTASHDQSQEISLVEGPKIIIAGAGMSHGGRIGGWEAKYLPDPKTTLLIVGYQAPGSPGRRLQDGAQEVKLNGEYVKVRAHIATIHGWSAHADRDELLAFVEESLKSKRVKTIFVAIGEPAAERFLAQRIHDYLGAKAIVPELGEVFEITKEGVKKV
jgi:metallo-beta-lactamase family protein